MLQEFWVLSGNPILGKSNVMNVVILSEHLAIHGNTQKAEIMGREAKDQKSQKSFRWYHRSIEWNIHI